MAEATRGFTILGKITTLLFPVQSSDRCPTVNTIVMRLTFRRWPALLLLGLLIGCYPDRPQNYTDFDLVYTNYSTDFPFSQRMTYSLPDSIIKITGDVFNNTSGTGEPEFISPEYSTVILAQIEQNMSNYGWKLVDKNANPDVILLVSAMTTTTIYYYYDWDYWDWWYPGWIPTWGWYYPGWYYPDYVSGYSSGSIFMQLVDQQTVKTQGGGNVPVEWNCILNGLTEGSTAQITARVQTDINKAFAQSPYLKH